MKKDVLDFIQKNQLSMEALGEKSMFLNDLEVGKIAHIISDEVEEQQLQFIIDQLNENKYVSLYTNITVKKKIKETFRDIAVNQPTDKELQDTKAIRGINTFLWMALGLAFIWLLGSLYYSRQGFPITPDNDVKRIFAPLVVLFILATGIDWIRSYLVKNQSINTYLQLNLFRPRRFKVGARLIFVDYKKLYIHLLSKRLGLDLGWYKLENTESIQDFQQIISKHTPLSKKEGMSENQTLIWLYEE